MLACVDSTYIRINRSKDFQFQKTTFCKYKGYNCIQIKTLVTTAGHLISVLGPFGADGYNTDSHKIDYIIKNNVGEVNDIFGTEPCTFLTDRGYSDSTSLAFGNNNIHLLSTPKLKKKNNKRLPTKEANRARLISKFRFVVETINLHAWKKYTPFHLQLFHLTYKAAF